MDSLALHNLKKASGSTKKSKRRGRGNSSGAGNYSGRGMKGQRSRSGGKKGLTMKGVKGYIFRVPKSRGFKSLATAPDHINLEILEKLFKDGEIVTPKKLFTAGLIKKGSQGYKILGKGKLNKKLIVKAHAFSAGAREAIIKAGGEIEELKNVRTVKSKNSRAKQRHNNYKK